MFYELEYKDCTDTGYELKMQEVGRDEGVILQFTKDSSRIMPFLCLCGKACVSQGRLSKEL